MIPSPLVSTAWLEEHLDEPSLRVLDCSVVMRTAADGTYSFVGGAQEYEQAHVRGAVFVDVLGTLAAKNTPLPMMMPSPEELAAVMGAHGVGRDMQVVLYDRSNHAWAARVWWMLRACSFEAAAVLDGGWQKWQAEGRPVSTEPGRYPAASFEARFRPELVASRERVLQALGERDVAVVNALSPEEHRGAAPTRFPRSGRIAGSANVFCQSLIDPETKAFWPREKLRELFAPARVERARATITYCGAGIAASADALALTALGIPNVAVYDGSLAEWTADPTLPMERG